MAFFVSDCKAAKSKVCTCTYFSDDGGSTSVQLFNIAMNVWIQGPALPVPMFDMKLLNIHGRVYLIGGNSNGAQNRQVYIMKLDLSGWDTHPESLSGDLDDGTVVLYNDG